jgi:uncharacterized sulfatase
MLRFLLPLLLATTALAADRPNILWLVIEDSSPHFGCYGDKNAVTPNVDALAARGMKYNHAWSNAPVCAAARTCIITGRWAPSNGGEHMRSMVPMPTGQKLFPQFLREAGYYCTNNAKEDYNVEKPEGTWDESSKEAHWKNRKPGQPFFAVFNHEKSHESQIRATPHTLIHDPAKVIVPDYMPDTPEVRHDWAQHFDNLTTVDEQIQRKIKEVEDAGLAEDTIIFFYADHGTGMARSKRWPYNSGLQVPMVVYFPEKWKSLAPKEYAPGASSDRLVSFIDLGPTVLSIAGVQPPDYFHGTAFAGTRQQEGRGLAFGFRGRMDERIDMSRSVTDGRYVFIMHYLPQLPEGQHIGYMFQQASTRVWHDLFVQGDQLKPAQEAFWKPKPSEELYDLQNDPWETNNLVGNPDQNVTRARLSIGLGQWMVQTRDLGIVPEAQRLADSKGASPADVFASDTVLPQKEVLQAAIYAMDRSYVDGDTSEPMLAHANATARYWGVQGLLMRGKDVVLKARARLQELLTDTSPSVRVAAAEALGKYGDEAEQAKAWEVLLHSAVPMNGSSAEANEALNVIDRLGDKALPKKDLLAAIDLTAPKSDPERLSEYPKRMLEYLGTTLGFKPLTEPKPKGGKKKGKK